MSSNSETDAERAVDEFHAHLDICTQCKGNPFALCPAGHAKLEAVGQACACEMAVGRA